jgi:hypothetical protein
VFILGAILLEASLLRPVIMFEKESKRPLLEAVPIALGELRGRYSTSYIEMLEKMLQFHSKLRPKFSEIILAVEEDDNLHEDTETSDGRQVSMVCEEQAGLTKMQSGCTNDVKIEVPHNSLNRSPPHHPNANMNTVSKNLRINFVESYPNSVIVQRKEEETLIKMLQTENLNSNHLNNSNQLMQSVHQEGPATQHFFFNSPKHHGLQPPLQHLVVSSQQRPIVQNGFITQNVQPQALPTTTVFKPLANVSNILNHPPFPPQSLQYPTSIGAPSARPLDPQNDRFSYTKFGNITLDVQRTKNKPIYSHEIPEINEILKTQNFCHSSMSSQGSITNLQSGNISIPPTLPLFATSGNLLPNYSSNPPPAQPKFTISQTQKISQSNNPLLNENL